MIILSRNCLLAAWSSINRKCYAALNSNSMSLRLNSTNSIILQSITKKVNPFGKLSIDLPFCVGIKPIDTHKYPNMDTLIINLFSIGPKPVNKSKIIEVDISSVCDIRTIDNQNDFNDNISCIIEAPINYDVDVKTVGEGHVDISGMISNIINVQTEYGNIIATKLQGKEISLSASDGGSITLQKNIQGDIEINTASNGSVNAEKCLGTRLDVSTENGDINIGSNYCEKATFTTLNGNLLLNNLHMDSTIDIYGNGSLNITCLDGSLRANLQEGQAKIQVVRITDNSMIQSAGEVHLNIPDDIDIKLKLISRKIVDIEPNIPGTLSKDGKQFTSISDNNNCHKFHVESNETIQVMRGNWIESLKLERCSKQK